MKRIFESMLCVSFIMCSAATGWAITYSFSGYGDSVDILGTGAVATEFSQAMQTTVSSGTGVILPFLTLDAGGSAVIEQGVNTDASPLPFDDKRPQWTNSLTLGDLQSANYHFMLDVNQAKSRPIISLDQFQVWLVPAAQGGSLVSKNNAGTYSELSTLLSNAGGTKVFDLGANNILIDYSLWSGSGNNLDMDLKVPTITGDPGDYLYVWSKFSQNNDGYEEWVVKPENAPAAVPEPGTLMLLGAGFLGLAIYGKHRKNA